jgi:uncharacterized protein (TIGR03435 family)
MNFARAALFAATVTASAQPQPEPRFEVASVKMGVPARLDQTDMRGGPGTADPGLIVYHNINFRTILLFALGGGPTTNFPNSRLETPDWMQTQNYDITAKVPAGATKAQANEMMLNLLKERFHLKLRHEMRQFDGYELTIAKSGLKIKESADPNAPQATAASIKYVENDFPQVTPGFTASPARVYNGRMFMTARNQPLGALVNLAMNTLGPGGGVQVQIADNTGLTGKYDWNVQFAGRPTSPDADPPGGPNVADAFEKQLGLKLEKKRVTLDVVVVDSADKMPVEN